MLVFGAKEIFYKMDKNYYGVVYESSQIYHCEELNLRHWDRNMFIQLCILSGCDYLNSPKGVGFKTAYNLIYKHKNIVEVLNNLKSDEIEE